MRSKVPASLQRKIETMFNNLNVYASMDACKIRHRKGDVNAAIRCGDDIEAILDKAEGQIRKKLGMKKRERFGR